MFPTIIAKESLNAINLSSLDDSIDTYTKQYFTAEAGHEHYRLLAHLSTLYTNRTIIDIGTNRGGSAVALSFNPNTKVITFDLENLRTIPINRPNIEFRIADVTKDIPLLLSSPLIMLDTYHDGTFEQHFYNLLLVHGYRGVLLLDDIHLNPEMKAFWNQIHLPKADLTAVGHASGTGVVYF